MRQAATVTPAELGDRLRASREMRGYTQAEVAAQLAVSRSTVAQMELGNRAVTSIELQRLADIYGRDVRHFLAPAFRAEDALSILFRADPGALEHVETRDRITEAMRLARSLSDLERLLEVQRDHGSLPTYQQPAMRSRWDAVQQGQALAEDERRRLGLGIAPLPDAEELLEEQGIRTASVTLPSDVSGMTLRDPDIGACIVVNQGHGFHRRRFSFMHEYEHVLADHSVAGVVSRSSQRDDLLEVRANSFAACVLMPEEGVRRFVATLGKGGPSRGQARVFDEEASLSVEGRATSGSQDLQLYDVARLADHYGVSRIAALYRLHNLRLLSAQRLEEMKAQEESGRGRELARALGLPARESEQDERQRDGFSRRLLVLALEAHRLGMITRAKCIELAKAAMPRADVVQLLADSGIGVADLDTLVPDEGR